MTLQQSIRLNDGMSSVLRTLQSNLKNTIVEFERMQQVSGQSVDISYMETAAQDIEQISEELRKAQQEQENFQNSTQSSKTATDSLLSSVRNVAVALGGWKAVSGIVELADTLTQTTARLDLMNDGLQTTEQLQNMIYQAAENSRGSYLDMQSMVSKLGLLAGDAFDSSAEIVAFAEQVNKQFAIAGTGATEASNATLQLTQALASGVLRGDELNSIFEQAPTLIQSIADYMGVSVGEIRNLASNGEITADIVKNAILDAADGVDARFNDMPVTWSQAWTSMQNYAIQAFDSVLEKISSATSSDTFQTVYEGAQQAITAIAGAASIGVDLIGDLAEFTVNNWSLIEPVIGGVAAALVVYNTAMTLSKTLTAIDAAIKGVHAAASAAQAGATFAATAAQYGMNAALLACPITWILVVIIAVIAAIYLVIAAINKVTGQTISATGVIAGAISTVLAFIGNLFLAALELVLGVIEAAWNSFADFANFLGNVFNDPIGSVINLFGNMGDACLGILEKIAQAMDYIFGSNLASAVSGWRSTLSALTDSAVSTYGNGTYTEYVSSVDADSILQSLGAELERFSYSDAYSSGYDWGSSLSVTDWLSDLTGITSTATDTASSLSAAASTSAYTPSTTSSDLADSAAQTASSTAATADTTSAISDQLDDNYDELSYLREIMEDMVLNKIYTTTITVQMENTIQNSSDRDLDGIVDSLSSKLSQAMSVSAEGVHV